VAGGPAEKLMRARDIKHVDLVVYRNADAHLSCPTFAGFPISPETTKRSSAAPEGKKINAHNESSDRNHPDHYAITPPARIWVESAKHSKQEHTGS
jgi:hypothetical protein